MNLGKKMSTGLILSLSLSCINKANESYRTEGFTPAVHNMPDMLAFYAGVFGINFTRQEQFDDVLYQGQWGDFTILLCPAVIAGNTASQNRHQFDVNVENLESFLRLCIKHGGTAIGVPTEAEGIRSIGIFDPDRNTLILKENLN